MVHLLVLVALGCNVAQGQGTIYNNCTFIVCSACRVIRTFMGIDRVC